MENCHCIYSMKTWIVKDIFKILEDPLPELNEISREKKFICKWITHEFNGH